MRRVWNILRNAGRGFTQDLGYLHASALTYYSTLSIVPVLAVAFGIAKGFGYDQTLRKELLEKFDERKELLTKALEFTDSMLHQVEGGMIAGVGAIALFFFVIGLFWSVETTFNTIWKVKKPRTIVRKVTDYLALMILCPIFLVAASSATVAISAFILQAAKGVGVDSMVNPLLLFGFRLIPFLLVWLLFTSLYLIMPNTNVKIPTALIASMIASLLYQGAQWVFITFQVGVSQYGAIYGSFAALPLFLLWLQVSWVIVLFGAEIAYHSEVELKSL